MLRILPKGHLDMDDRDDNQLVLSFEFFVCSSVCGVQENSTNVEASKADKRGSGESPGVVTISAREFTAGQCRFDANLSLTDFHSS
jgi:hypothetical protein